MISKSVKTTSARRLPERFPLGSEDCELLVAFAETGSLAALADRSGRDISVISRQMNRLADRAPVLEKNGGRWQITSAGRELVKWTREALRSQAALLGEPSRLSIVTTHEFGARILSPDLRGLLGDAGAVATIRCTDDSIEPWILSGEAEFGFDCGRPESPLIQYRLVRNEPLCLIATPAFIRRHAARDWRTLIATPYFEYSRLPAEKCLGLKTPLISRAGRINTVAGARAAVLAGEGWSIVPKYTVLAEIRDRSLTAYAPESIVHERFGVWWLRGNLRTERERIPRALVWLAERDLG